MEDEKLIEVVRKYEFIYNLKHPKYMDNIKKEIAWKEIGDQLKQSAAACKQRWQCLRDAYRRALNKRKGKSGQAVKNIKQWKYENEMAFVSPFILERKTQDTFDITSDDKLSDNVDKGLTSNEAMDSNRLLLKLDEVDTPSVIDDASMTASKYVPQDILSKCIKKPRAIKRRSLREPSAILLAKLFRSKLNTRRHDHLDSFFLSISDTVKKFSPYLQAVAKNKIFSLVSEIELQQLAPNSPYACPSPSASNGEIPIPGGAFIDQKPRIFL
ncbi:uncharacterized protein LOC119835993 [Zerene cesonia]|uniref:uncharacterized protein LOC119835993 n=1 Tax=Zerene cesonia TaxID=33412 RepID=UPI0018E57D26|nr:uncharacterized protein LOC119835993 [Zerene cesonia]